MEEKANLDHPATRDDAAISWIYHIDSLKNSLLNGRLQMQMATGQLMASMKIWSKRAITGYVGGRLIPALLAAGYWVRAMGRSLEKWVSDPESGTPGFSWCKAMFWTLNFSNRQFAGNGCPIIWFIPWILIYCRYQIYKLLSTSTKFVWPGLPWYIWSYRQTWKQKAGHNMMYPPFLLRKSVKSRL